ncbi:MAG: response regulator, partial [bacterium]|nr:response regulator [bacterium]
MTDFARRPTRILLVDDNENVRRSLRNLIETGGDHCLVTAVASGVEALKALAERSYDIALCDLALPGDVDGIEVTRRVRGTRPEVRVVVFTGEGTVERKQEALDAGAFIYLAKPYKTEELLHLIEALTSIRRTESQTGWLKTLTRLATDFQATFDYGQIARRVVEGALDLGFARARLYDFDEEREVLRGLAASGAESSSMDFNHYEIPFTQFIRFIFTKVQPTIWDRAILEREFPHAAGDPWIHELGLPDIPWIDCPLQVEGRRVGTLAVDHLGEEDVRCTQEDLEIMGLYSVMVAQALHNSTLYTQEALAKASLIALLEDAPDAVFTADLKGTINFVSPSGERVTTWPAEEMLGKRAAEFYTDADGSPDVGPQVAQEIMEGVRAEGTLRNVDIYLKARQGPPQPMATSVSLLHDRKGEEIGTLAFLKNRSLLDTEPRRYRDLLEGFGYGTLLLTRGMRVEFINRKAEGLLRRRRRGEVQGKPFTDLLLEGHREEFRQKFREVLGGGEEAAVDLHVLRPDGTRLALKARMNPTRSEKEILGVTLALYDMEEIGAIIQSGRLMALGEMVGGVAHEINNPLNNVTSAAHNLREDLQTESSLTESRSRLLDIVGRGCQRITDLVNRMKDFGSPSNDLMEPLSLNEVIEDSASFFATRLANHGIELVVDLQPDLPLVWGDTKRLQQVFVNLLTNAEQALEGQEPPQQIFLETMAAGPRRVRACVTDSGCGIPEEVREAIFDPFFTTRPSRGGTGLGLSICKSILDLHQGKIHVTGGPGGRGTTFHLILLCAMEE